MLDLLARAEVPWMGLLTVVLQSSIVVSGLAIVLVQQGALQPLGAVAVVVGATLGTTATSLIASIPMDRFARRAAQMNLMFNAVGVVLILPFITVFGECAIRQGGSAGQAVALANLSFDLGVALMFLPFTAWMGRRFAPPGDPQPSAENAPI